MTSRDQHAIAGFREGHMHSVPKMLKEIGGLRPMIHLFGRKNNDYGMALFPVIFEGEVPIPVIRMVCDKMFDELLCLSHSSEATMWHGDFKAAGISKEELAELDRNDPRILAMKKNAKKLDVLWITFETDGGQDVKVYEVIKTGSSMVNVLGDLRDDIQLKEMHELPNEPDHLTGRFANLFKRIKGAKL